ncbi:MAG: hypothetical protein ABIH59_01775 [archaeon]
MPKKNIIDLLCEKGDEAVYNFFNLYVPENPNSQERIYGFPLQEEVFRDLLPHFTVGRDDTYLEDFALKLPQSNEENQQRIIDVGSKLFNEYIERDPLNIQKVHNIIEIFGMPNPPYWSKLKVNHKQLLEYAKKVPKDATCEKEWVGTNPFYEILLQFIYVIQEDTPFEYKKEYMKFLIGK